MLRQLTAGRELLSNTFTRSWISTPRTRPSGSDSKNSCPEWEKHRYGVYLSDYWSDTRFSLCGFGQKQYFWAILSGRTSLMCVNAQLIEWWGSVSGSLAHNKLCEINFGCWHWKKWYLIYFWCFNSHNVCSKCFDLSLNIQSYNHTFLYHSKEL